MKLKKSYKVLIKEAFYRIFFRIKQRIALWIFFAVSFLTETNSCSRSIVVIPPHEISSIGLKVWRNEDARLQRNLVRWNKGENWASLGIAHFTWHPKGSKKRGSFPELVSFLEKNGNPFPAELESLDVEISQAPWVNREEFLSQDQTEVVKILRRYMINTIALQMKFIVQRVERALPILLRLTPEPQRDHIEQQFSRLFQTPAGRYILVDYLNLAGEGGLLKVLKNVQGSDPEEAPREFVRIAQLMLTNQTINNASNVQWLKGWINRLKTYTGHN